MKTIIDLFEESVKKYPDNPYLYQKIDGQYKPMSYSETREKVVVLAAGLIKSGIRHGDRIALLSEGRNDWVISELAILYAGAVNVPLSVKLEPSDILFRLSHSETLMVIVSGSQAQKIRAVMAEVPTLETVVLLDGEPHAGFNEIAVHEVFSQGTVFLQQNEEVCRTRYSQVKPGDYANISYTSGTTADPKGIILSHRNYTANVEQASTLMDIPETFRTLLILPLDHSFAHVAGIYSFMLKGASLGFVETGKTPMLTLKNIPVNIKEFKPNLILSVPALAKNFKKNIDAAIQEKGPVLWKMYRTALHVAYQYNKEGYNKGTGFSWMYYPLLRLFDVILFKKIRQNFGGHLDFFIGGGALLDIELQRFFYAIGIPMLQGYGLSEATPIISSNSLARHKLGSSGHLVKFLDLKIVDEKGNTLKTGEKGEIVVKGENVMVGYWKNQVATSETVKDGWLYTGDLGYTDEDGFLYVLGRFKSLLIASDGEKYSPEGIEETLVQHSRFIDQVMLYNEQSPYTIALIVPNREKILKAVSTHHPDAPVSDVPALAVALIQSQIDAYRKGGKYEGMFPERWLPATFALLPEAFTEDNKMINSTLKMVRGKITSHYRELIQFLYTPEGKNPLNEKNFSVFLPAMQTEKV